MSPRRHETDGSLRGPVLRRLSEVFVQFWPALRPLRWWLVLGLVLLAVSSLTAIAEILLFQHLVDDVLVPATFEPLLWIALTYVGLNVLSAIVSGGEDILSTWVSASAT